MVLLKYLVITLSILSCTKADNANYSDVLKSCLEVSNQVCLTGNGSYSRPSSVLLNTEFRLTQIIDIDVEKNSIKLQGSLISIWEDPGVATSTETYFMVGDDIESILWRPWIEFENLLSYEKTQLYGGTKSSSFWKGKNTMMIYGEDFHLTFYCRFRFIDYPFDSHECTLMYREKTGDLNNVTIVPHNIWIGNLEQKDGNEPIILDDLPFPFAFKLKPLPTITIPGYLGSTISKTGILFKMKRNDFGKLLASYYYPMASFAALSLISFLINPDIVSYLIFTLVKHIICILKRLKVNTNIFTRFQVEWE
jgi:hypothetical protein